MDAEKATTPELYLAQLPEDRKKALAAVRKIILANLPQGYEEGISYGMIGYFVPLSRYPNTYNKKPLQLAALGSQKSHMAVYLSSIYSDSESRTWFEKAYSDAGKKLDAGKSCVRFKRLEDLPLSVIGEAIARAPVETFLAQYEAAKSSAVSTEANARKSAAKSNPGAARKSK